MPGSVDHQFSLFGFQRPRLKVPISAERIRKIQAAVNAGDGRTALERMRDLNDHLQRIEKRISHQ